MPRPHIAMRKIRDLLRLRLGEGLSLRQVSSSLGVPLMTVSDHLRRAERAGLSWPLPAGSTMTGWRPAVPRRRPVAASCGAGVGEGAR